jgi:hypothetical protein
MVTGSLIMSSRLQFLVGILNFKPSKCTSRQFFFVTNDNIFKCIIKIAILQLDQR